MEKRATATTAAEVLIESMSTVFSANEYSRVENRNLEDFHEQYEVAENERVIFSTTNADIRNV